MYTATARAGIKARRARVKSHREANANKSRGYFFSSSSSLLSPSSLVLFALTCARAPAVQTRIYERGSRKKFCELRESDDFCGEEEGGGGG